MAALLVAGGVTAVLLLNSGDDGRQPQPQPQAQPPTNSAQQDSEPPAMPPPRQPASSPGASDGGGQPAPAGQPTNDELATALFNAFAAQDSRAFAELVCRSIPQAGQSSIAPGATAEPNGAPTDDGNTGVIPVTVTVNGKTSAGQFQSKREAGSWCIVGAS